MMKKTIVSTITLAMLTMSFSGCGSSSDEKTKIDLAEYYPKESAILNRVEIYYHEQAKIRDEKYYEANVTVDSNHISYEMNNTVEIIATINNEDINLTYPKNPSFNVTDKRYVAIGDEISSTYSSESRNLNGEISKKTETRKCILESKISEFEGDSNYLKEKYEGDIIVEMCTSNIEVYRGDLNLTRNHVNTEYFYSKKGVGQIAQVNRTCWHDTGYKNEDGTPVYVGNDNNTSCDITELYIDMLLE
jgi:hypothetical protein